METGMVSGIDVSHHNGAVSWATVAGSGIAFAFAKASEGLNTKDAEFQNNFSGMKQSGIIRGAYHFFHPELDPVGQADNFLQAASGLSLGDLPPALDLEINGRKSASEVCAAAQTWIDAVEKALGRLPIIYTSAGFWNDSVGATQAFGKYPLWVAHYTTRPAPALPKGWSDFTIWQYSESGAVPGIAGSVDLNRFNGTMDDLRRFVGA